MLGWIVGSSLRFRLLAIALGAAVLAAGANQARQMPVDALPEFAPPMIEVQTEALGLSAPEVEDLVTLNLEELLNGTPWLTDIHSTTVPGLSSILLTFEPGTDVLRARQLVQERLALSFAIPNVAKPPVIIQPLSTTNRVMMVGLSSKTVSPIEMGILARWNIRPALLAVPGVANVSIWGQRERQLQVQVDADRLLANHVSVDQIIETTGNAMWVSPLTFLQASTPGSGGWIDTPQQRLEVRHIFPIVTAGDLSKVTVDGAAPLRLSDVADVVEDHQPLIGDAVLTGGEDSLIVIEKFPNANTLDVTRGVEEALDKLRPGLAGIADGHVDRAAGDVHRRVDRQPDAGGGDRRDPAGRRPRRAPLPVAGGADRGLRDPHLADGRRAGARRPRGVDQPDGDRGLCDRRRRPDRRRRELDRRDCEPAFATTGRPATRTSLSAAIIEATVASRSGVVYATLIALLPLLPYLFAEGVAQAVSQPLVLSYVLAVLASALVALTVTPALAYLLYSHGGRRPGVAARPPGLRRVRARARAPARAPAAVVGGSAAVLVLALVVGPSFDQSLLPSFRDPDLVVRWNAAAGTSEPEMARLTTRVTNDLRSIPGVANVGAHVGRAVLGDQVVDVNSAELWVTVDPSADYSSTDGQGAGHRCRHTRASPRA